MPIWVELILICVLLLWNQHKRISEEKKNKQLQIENNNLMEQIKFLTHENNILKNQSADTK